MTTTAVTTVATSAIPTPGVTHSVRYRVRRRDLVCFQFTAARWRVILGIRRQPSSSMWRRKPKVAATGVVAGLLEWTAMEALRPFVGPAGDVLGTSVDITHCAPAFRGDMLFLTARCVHVAGGRSVWLVHAYHGAQVMASGEVGFSTVATEDLLRRWAPKSRYRRSRLRPRWGYRMRSALWRTVCPRSGA